jgi:hypothetical protein
MFGGLWYGSFWYFQSNLTHDTFLIGSCCRAGGCKITPTSKCDPERFVVGEHTCDAHCGACCGGDVDDKCQNDYTRQQCNDDNGQFKVNGVCANDCGKFVECLLN